MKCYLLYISILMLAGNSLAKGRLQITTEFKPDVCNKKATNGDEIAVHYTGKLENGQVFDSSVISKRDPIKFQLGHGKVIQGWEKGILGMCVGEKRNLVIPAELAYGSAGFQNVIPPDATLEFDVELMEIERQEVSSWDKIQNIVAIAIWPAVAAILLVILYRKIGEDEEEERLQKLERKGKKKKN